MGNIIFKTSDHKGDGFNPLVDNLLCSSDSIGTFPSTVNNMLELPVCCYNEYQYPLQVNSYDITDITKNSVEQHVSDHLIDIEKNPLNDSYFDHIFPKNINSQKAKELGYSCYYVDNSKTNWMNLYVIMKEIKSSYLSPLNYTSSLNQIDKQINFSRSDKFVFQSENYIEELINIYAKTGSNRSNDFYFDFFFNKPISLISLCNKFDIDYVVDNYLKLLIESNNHKTMGKRNSKDWIIDIDFSLLIQDRYNNSLSYYEDICNKLDIYPNYNYFEIFHTMVSSKNFEIFSNANTNIVQEIVTFYYENY